MNAGSAFARVNAVRTTGIYCRASCSARPLLHNTRSMSSAVAAEVAGYRPCLRCRPDRLPVVAVDGTGDEFVAVALALISDGYLDDQHEGELAATLGFSTRHLRRLFREHLGATPTQVAISRRAHFARTLLDDTDLPVTDIAFEARFGSVRRMNEVVRSTFGFSPTELRAKRTRGERSSADGGLRLKLYVSRDHCFASYLAAIAHRAVPGVEVVEGRTFRRATTVCGHAAVIEANSLDATTIEVVAHVPAIGGLLDIVSRCRRVFRLDHSTEGPPGAWSTFEQAVVDVVRRTCPAPNSFLESLVHTFGEPIPGVEHLGITHQFPTPAALLTLADAHVPGLSRATARALVQIAVENIDAVASRVHPDVLHATSQARE